MSLMTNTDKTETIIPPKKADDLTLRDLSWFSQRVERGRREIFSEIVTITPEIAKRLLEQNVDNRKLNRPLIDAIVRDIKNGHWQLNGESIIVTRDGQLNDGQNRLTAIVEADIPVQSLIAFGVSRASRFTVDMDAAREASQFLMMNGVGNADKMAAAVRLQLTFLRGKVNRIDSRDIIKQDVIAAFNQERDEFERAYHAIGSSKFSATVGGGSFLTVAYFNIHRVDSINCDIFFDKLQIGADLKRDNPIFWLRQKLMEILNMKKRDRAEARLEMVIRYWNAWAKGRKLTGALKMNATYPKIIPATGRN